MSSAASERVLAELDPPQLEKGIGKLISSAGSADLIEGVRVQPYAVWPDDRGYFLEAARLGQGLVAGFPAASTQVSSAVSYPGTIKAFHFHRHQTDVWIPMAGMLQVALVDLRADSAT